MAYRVLSIALGVLSLVGCGGDDDDGTSSTTDGTGGTGGTSVNGAGGGGGTMGEGGAGATQNVECDPEGSGVCENDGDCSAVESGEVRVASQVCGVQCLEDDDPATCSVQCVVSEAGISSGCAVCYAGAVGCATERCFNECIENAASDECTECQVEQDCRSEFSDCSGLPAD